MQIQTKVQKNDEVNDGRTISSDSLTLQNDNLTWPHGGVCNV